MINNRKRGVRQKSNESGSPDTLSISDIFTKVGGALAGLTVIALIMGRSELNGYFGELSAPWALAMMSPTRLISASFYPFYFIFTILMTLGLANNLSFFKDRRSLALAYVVSAGSCVIVGAWILYPSLRTSVRPFNFTMAAGVTVLTGAAIAATSLYVEVNKNGIKLKRGYFYLLGYAVIGIAMVGPNLVGRARAMQEYSDTGKQPFVNFSSPLHPQKLWVLVTPLDTGFLIMSFGANKRDRVFRVVSSSELGEIERLVLTPVKIEK